MSFINETTLNWENLLSALNIIYINSCHSISTTTFELLIGEKARLPSFPNKDIQNLDYNKISPAQRFNILQKSKKQL